MSAQGGRSRCWRSKQKIPSAFTHSHRPASSKEVETIATPASLFRRPRQALLHRIVMHIPQLLHAPRAGDKVQVVDAVGPMQPVWHDKPNGTGSIAARPCKQRKDVAPTVPVWGAS